MVRGIFSPGVEWFEECTINILAVEGVTKSFFGIKALDDVSFNIKEGEILTILGENGAGKSTLMNILTGVYQMDAGIIRLNGNPMDFRSPQDAINAGIGMVHQHFMLAEAQSVFENILISFQNLPFFLNLKAFKQQINDFIHKFNLTFQVDTPIYKLSVGEQQWVEIIKLLIRRCNILILDEPTAVLTPQEADKLFDFLKQLKNQGKSIIFISHKMKEVMELSDRVVILKKGVVVSVLEKNGFTEQDLARLMIGGDPIPDWEKRNTVSGQILLDLQNLTAVDDRGLKELDGLSLELKEGEILGITGVAGNGQKALAETLTGLRPLLSGSIWANGIDITHSNARHTYIAGIAHIPEDRKSIGIAPDLSVDENMVMKNFRQPEFRKFKIFQNRKAIRNYTQTKINTFAIKAGPVGTPIRLLSGGNIQKVIIARELSGKPLVLVALYPTRGLDIGAAEYVHKVMSDAAARGMSILLISEDLEELLKMSDRLAVIFRGKIVGALDPLTATREQIGLMMSGSLPDATEIRENSYD